MPAVAEPPKPAPTPTPPPQSPPPPPPKVEHGQTQAIPGTSATNIPEDDPFKAQDEEIAAKFRKAEGVVEPKKEAPRPEPGIAPAKVEQKKVEAVPQKPPTEGGKMRAELERLSGELKNKNDAYTALETKLKELETKGQNTDKLVERMGTLEKEIAARDAQLRRLRKERSPEFIKNHQKPFESSAANAKEIIESLQVETKNADGEVTSVRQANWKQDFSRLYQMDRPGARKMAKDTFGEDWDTVMGFYDDLHRREREMQSALQEEEEQAAKLDKEEETTRIQREEELKAHRSKVTADLANSVEGYRDPADDKDLALERKKGYDLWDFEPKTYQQALVKEAHLKHRSAAYGPNQIIIARLKQQVESLKGELEGLKNPPPPLGKTKTPGSEGGGKAPEKSWEEEAREVLSNA